MRGALYLKRKVAAIQRLGGKARISHISPKTGETPDFLYAALAMVACAAFINESRIKFVCPTKHHRKSGIWGTPCAVVRTNS
jgi:hypothetical protein